MTKSYLVDILKTFSPKEIKEFTDFVRSPYYNKNQNVLKLYMYLRKCYPEFDEKKVLKESVHSVLFPGEKYNDGFMRKLIFNLTNLAEKYMLSIKTGSDSMESRFELIDELLKRELNKLFLKHFNDLSKEVENTETKDYKYYRRKYMLEVNHTRYTDNIRYKIDLHDSKEFHNVKMKNKLFYFTNNFLLLSLDMYRTLKYQGYTDRFEYSDLFIDNIIGYLIGELNETSKKENEGFTDNLTIKVYLYEIMLMRNKSSDINLPDDIYFSKLKEILCKVDAGLSHDSRFSLYNILLQHCANRILRGYSDYRKERWELDKIALKDRIFMSQSETDFPPPAFASMVRDAAEMREFESAENFISQYKDTLESNNFETVMNLSNALLKFHMQEYEQALKLLNRIKPVKRWEFKFAVKELTLMVYYELSMFQQAYYLVDSFRHFIASMARNFSQERIDSRNNFLKIYMKVLKMKENSDPEEIENIKTELDDKKQLIFNRDWLEEKAKELRQT